MFEATLPEEIVARLGRPMPWWRLLDDLDLAGNETITRQAGSFAQKLSKFRVAVVPDPRIDAGGVTGDSPCIAFRVSACQRHVTHDYAPAKLQLKRDLAFLMVKGRPSPRELNWVRNKGLDAFRLDGESRERLMACIDLMLETPIENAHDVFMALGAEPSLAHRGDQLMRYRALCEADGPLNPSEDEALKLVRPTKGLAVRGQMSIFDQAPPSSPTAPKVPLTKPVPRTLAFLLDAERLAAISQQTKAVTQLLGEVFSEAEPPVEPADAPSLAVSLAAPQAAHPSALMVVAQRPSWVPCELYEQWEALGLMPEAVLENLNERALELCGELLLEGEAVLDVNPLALSAFEGAA